MTIFDTTTKFPTDLFHIRDDFAGPGGWDVALDILKSDLRMIGVEFDKAACETASAAGYDRLLGSVTDVAPGIFGDLSGYIASPPCQTFSAAGNGAGRRALNHLISAAVAVADGMLPADAVAAQGDAALDERSVLVLEPLRVIRNERPRWVALEQVPAVLPIWEAYVSLLLGMGYSARAENLHAEQYGVPQTRKRAILVAVRTDVMEQHGLTEVPWPEATHSRYYPRNPARLDEGVEKWVTMAEALSFGMTERPSMTVTGGGTETGGAEPFGNGARQAMANQPWADAVVVSNYGTNGDKDNRGQRTGDQPAATVTSKIDRNKVYFGDVRSSNGCIRPEDAPSPTITASADNGNFRFVAGAGMTGEGRPRPVEAPAPTITGKGTAYGMDEASEWRAEAAVEGDTSWSDVRPSPTIVGSFAPDVVAAPGYRKAGDPPRQKTPGSVRITVQQAGILQSFPADYPWTGNKGKQFQQAGNAIPPVLAAAVLRGIINL